MTKYQIEVGWAVTKYQVGVGWAGLKYKCVLIWPNKAWNTSINCEKQQ